MARLDPYAACPCGSGKKARWCCEFIFDDINKAFEFEKEGQHEAALRLIDELVAKNPTNPEVWGRKRSCSTTSSASRTRRPPCKRLLSRAHAIRSATISRADFAWPKERLPGR